MRSGARNAVLQNAKTMELRGARLLRVGMVAAVCLVFALAYLDLLREQERALDDFTAEQASLSRAVAGTLEARLQEVMARLDGARVLAGSSELQPYLERALADQPLYREIDVLDRQGRVQLALTAVPDRRIDGSPTLEAARAAASRELVGDGLWVSGPLRRSADDRERLRLFARGAGERVVMALVDCDRFFDGLWGPDEGRGGRRPGKWGQAPRRWIVLDDARRWIDFAPPPLAAARFRLDDAQLPAGVVALLELMATGQSGVRVLDRAAAASLGLEPRRAVAGLAPVRVAQGRVWSLAVVTSAMRVRDRARVSAWRLGASTAMAGLLVALFGVVIGRQEQRARSLAEALRLAETTAALRERSEKLVDAVPLGVVTLDGQEKVVAVNPYLQARGVRTGGALADAFPHAATDERQGLQALLDEARALRRPLSRAGLRLRLAGEEARDVDALAIPLQHPLPEADCFLVLHDRTEMRQLERNLQRAEKLATIGTLAAGIAHEVGTPLGIISGRAEQLLGKLPAGDEPAHKAVTSILSQVDKVSTTIRQLLDFARARPVEAQAVTPTQVLSTCAALLEHRFRQAKVTLTVEAPPTVPAVRGDAGQLEQVFVNLLINAVDACQAGGQVRARALGDGAQVAIEIADDGCGISRENLPRVLDPFFTTKKRGQGTGLGLSIAADIVKNHGGQLDIDSDVGKGTRVTVRLPMAEVRT